MLNTIPATWCYSALFNVTLLLWDLENQKDINLMLWKMAMEWNKDVWTLQRLPLQYKRHSILLVVVWIVEAVFINQLLVSNIFKIQSPMTYVLAFPSVHSLARISLFNLALANVTSVCMFSTDKLAQFAQINAFVHTKRPFISQVRCGTNGYSIMIRYILFSLDRHLGMKFRLLTQETRESGEWRICNTLFGILY